MSASQAMESPAASATNFVGRSQWVTASWSRLAPQTQEAIDDALTDKPEYIGILLHGSRSLASFDAWSDIDLICIPDPAAGAAPYDLKLPPVFDLQITALKTAQERLEAVPLWNSSYMLRGFVEGLILRDTTGEMARLRAIAATIWEQGPAELTAREREEILTNMDKQLSALGRTIHRFKAGTIPTGLVWQDLHETFKLFFWRYHQLFRLWTLNLPAVMRRSGPPFDLLKSHALGFLDTTDVDTAYAALQRFARFCIEGGKIRMDDRSGTIVASST